MENISYLDNKILRMMQKMGYKSGLGLGKSEQGITKSLDVKFQLGKKGFGMKLKNIGDFTESWNFSKEEISVKEKVEWLQHQGHSETYSLDKMLNWIKEGSSNISLMDDNLFCDQKIFNDLLQAKEIFNELDLMELIHARSRANPFETIRSAFFMNRAALKIANIDAATDFMLSNIDINIHHREEGPFYFADVCGGPGGFSEYILWRKKWYFKGFGLTLKNENDFKLNNSICASAATFQSLYGEEGDGNVCCPANIWDFRRNIMFETNGKGVHFVMSDGGFSVEGNEDLQEVLSKNIYICQCLVALEVLRVHGHFITKLFDIFTPFSVGLIYLMYKCFEKVAILKPNSSRPANAERYLVCSNLKPHNPLKRIRSYLWVIVKKFWALKDDKERDILEIVPLAVIKQDEKFYCYIMESNKSLGLKQIAGLRKLAAFCCNPTLIESRQKELRMKCLEFWKIPDRTKDSFSHIPIDDLINSVIDRPEILLVQPREINNLKNFNATTTDVEDWHYCGMCSSRQSNVCYFYAGTSGSKVYRLQKNQWVKMKNLQLCKGTVLYGEFVKEISTTKSDHSDSVNGKQRCRYTLHVIDALQLGKTSLANMRFKERMEIIRIYCKSVNKEFQHNSIKIRQKVFTPLADMKNHIINRNELNTNYVSVLPILGFTSSSERFELNSILCLKTNHDQSFQSTYVLRIQIFISPVRNDNEDVFSLEEVINAVK